MKIRRWLIDCRYSLKKSFQKNLRKKKVFWKKIVGKKFFWKEIFLERKSSENCFLDFEIFCWIEQKNTLEKPSEWNLRELGSFFLAKKKNYMNLTLGCHGRVKKLYVIWETRLTREKMKELMDRGKEWSQSIDQRTESELSKKSSCSFTVCSSGWKDIPWNAATPFHRHCSPRSWIPRSRGVVWLAWSSVYSSRSTGTASTDRDRSCSRPPPGPARSWPIPPPLRGKCLPLWLFPRSEWFAHLKLSQKTIVNILQLTLGLKRF